jgi:hypothetical protein
MRTLAVIIAVAFFALGCVGGTPPPPRTPYHLLLGPYEYELTREQEARYLALDAKRYKSFEALNAAIAALPRGKRVPRHFTLDDKRYTSIPALKAAIAALPPRSTVYLRGSCNPYSTIDLPPRPISLSALRAYCSSHRITFTWTFGPGGY